MECSSSVFRGRHTGALIAAGVTGLLLGATVPAVAQKSSPPSFYKLTLREGVSKTGRAGGYQGQVDRTGHRLVAENLSIVQPVTIVVVASDVKKPIQVDLVKAGWNEPLRSGKTDASGRLVFRTRTEGNMGILVRSVGSEPAPYAVAMWVGAERPSRPASPFKAKRRR